MGKYQAYLEYRDSGLEWFGDIPSDWDVWKWKHTLTSPMTYGANEAALDDDVKNPRYIRITDMNSDGSLRDDTFKSLPLEAAKNYLLKDGDILVARTGATVGKSFLYKEKFGAACYAGYLIRARINKSIVEPEFISWYLQSDQYWKYISSSQIQATLQNVSAEKYGDMQIAIPPKRQDRLSIANFLDHETKKIDTLIEKQQQLIHLLREKRQSVISHAVTKGLNHDAPMKHSGVDWLGEVPEHWEVLTTKRFFKLVSDPAPDNNDMELLSVYTDIGVRPRKDLEAKGNKASTTDGYWLVKKDDLIVNKLLAWMGAVGYSAYDGVTSPAYDILRKTRKLNTKFFHYLFRTKLAQSEFKRWSRGIMEMRLRLYFEELGRIGMPFPPDAEQDLIVEEIERIEFKYDHLIETAERQIALSQERRTALISAAVTGKIDVRNFVSEDVQALQN